MPEKDFKADAKSAPPTGVTREELFRRPTLPVSRGTKTIEGVDPSTRSHAGRLYQRANATAMWFTCQQCGTRWQRAPGEYLVIRQSGSNGKVEDPAKEEEEYSMKDDHDHYPIKDSFDAKVLETYDDGEDLVFATEEEREKAWRRPSDKKKRVGIPQCVTLCRTI